MTIPRHSGDVAEAWADSSCGLSARGNWPTPSRGVCETRAFEPGFAVVSLRGAPQAFDELLVGDGAREAELQATAG